MDIVCVVFVRSCAVLFCFVVLFAVDIVCFAMLILFCFCFV